MIVKKPTISSSKASSAIKRASSFTSLKQSPVQRTVSTITDSVARNARGALREVVGDLAYSLIENGLSAQSISYVASQKLDSIINSASDEFFAIARSSINAETIINSRRTSRSNKSDPKSKIQSARNSISKPTVVG